MNCLTLVGHLAKDAEAMEKSIMLSIATKEGYDKEKKEARSYFVNVFAINVSEKLVPYLQKGRLVLIQNAVVSNGKTKDGSYRTFVRVYARNGNIRLLGSKPKAEGTESGVSEEKTDKLPY